MKFKKILFSLAAIESSLLLENQSQNAYCPTHFGDIGRDIRGDNAVQKSHPTINTFPPYLSYNSQTLTSICLSLAVFLEADGLDSDETTSLRRSEITDLIHGALGCVVELGGL